MVHDSMAFSFIEDPLEVCTLVFCGSVGFPVMRHRQTFLQNVLGSVILL
jgi:hypothetical protein